MRYDDHGLNAFRNNLRERYRTIDDLNRHWGTSFADFASITAESIKNSDSDATIAPMLQFKLFSDRLFADYFRIAADEVKKLDPRSRYGVSGTRDPGHYIGFDWSELMKHVTHLAFYDGLQRECIRSFKKPGDLITSFVGYDFLDLDERNTRYFPWLELFNGFQGISIYSASSSAWHGYVRHDLSWPERAKWTMEELAELKNGTGKAILTADRDPAPIAVHYSQRSLHAAPRGQWLSNATGICEVLKDMGLQFDFVHDEQIEAGMLARKSYKVFFLPLAQVLSDREIAEITQFVNGGGRLIAVGRVGRYNGAGKVHNESALADVLGTGSGGAASATADGGAVDVFGRKLTVRIDDPGIVAAGAEVLAAFQDDATTPAVTRNPVGDGEAWFVNMLWDSYRSFRSGGVGGEIVDRTSTDEQTAATWRHLIQNLLAGTGIAAPAVITRNGETVPYIEQVVYRHGPVTYLGILPRYFGGRYARGTEREWIKPKDFIPVEIGFQRKSYVYDMRRGAALGQTASIPTRITNGIALLYALTPYPVESLQVQAPASANPGENIDVAVRVRARRQEPGDHVVHLDITGPDPAMSDCHKTNLVTDGGSGRWTVPLAQNAPPGTWTVTARDTISGTTARAAFTVDAP